MSWLSRLSTKFPSARQLPTRTNKIVRPSDADGPETTCPNQRRRYNSELLPVPPCPRSSLTPKARTAPRQSPLSIVLLPVACCSCCCYLPPIHRTWYPAVHEPGAELVRPFHRGPAGFPSRFPPGRPKLSSTGGSTCHLALAGSSCLIASTVLHPQKWGGELRSSTVSHLPRSSHFGPRPSHGIATLIC